MDTVTSLPGRHEVLHMGVVGYILGLGALLMLLPLAPLLIVLKLYDMARSGGAA